MPYINRYFLERGILNVKLETREFSYVETFFSQVVTDRVKWGVCFSQTRELGGLVFRVKSIGYFCRNWNIFSSQPILLN